MKLFDLQSLESRRMLAASAQIVSGVLRVNGATLARNTIVVSNTVDNLSVDVLIQHGTKTVHATFLKTDVTSVAIRGGLARDTITIDQTNSAFAIDTVIDGRFANDTIVAGDENDTVIGSFGNDTIDAGAGANVVRGGFGNDTITTGIGADKINGNFGSDSIVSGAGADTVVGSFGNDVIDAGTGSDLVFAGAGRDTVVGGTGNDTLWGSGGADVLNGNAGADTLGGVIGRNTLIGGTGQDTFRVTDLTLSPSNDYNTAEDILINVHDDEGGPDPEV